MSKNIEDYNEQIEKEFNSSQKEVTSENLGKVTFNKVDLDEDPNVKRINDSIGYLDVPLDMLPSGGRFYPENTRISIRAARVGEIREFSTIDETNTLDVIDKLTYIVQNCVKMYYGNTLANYKDIIAADRIVLVLKIRELTFTDGAQSIMIPVPKGACKTSGCVPQKEVPLNTLYMNFLEPSHDLEKYYDQINRCYNITTKRFGNITLYVPNIGVSSAILEYAMRKQNEGDKIEVTLTEILQFMIKDWRGLSDRAIFSKVSEMTAWPAEKFALVYRLVEMINVGIDFTMNAKCETCGGDIKIPINLSSDGGYKQLFIPTISSLIGELD